MQALLEIVERGVNHKNERFLRGQGFVWRVESQFWPLGLTFTGVLNRRYRRFWPILKPRKKQKSLAKSITFVL